jgi:hypothetical protein
VARLAFELNIVPLCIDVVTFLNLREHVECEFCKLANLITASLDFRRYKLAALSHVDMKGLSFQVALFDRSAFSRWPRALPSTGRGTDIAGVVPATLFSFRC